MIWLANLNHGGSEPGAGPVGPVVGKGLMLVFIGRVIVLGCAVDLLRRMVLAVCGE